MKTKYILKAKIVYGIATRNGKGGESKPIFVIDKPKKKVAEFVKLCNAEGLEPIHLRDAIDDILYG